MIPDTFKNILLKSMYEHIYAKYGDNSDAIGSISFSYRDIHLAKGAPELLDYDAIGQILKNKNIQTLKTEGYITDAQKIGNYYLTEKGFYKGRELFSNIKPAQEISRLSTEQKFYHTHPIKTGIVIATVAGLLVLIAWAFLKHYFE